MPKALHKKLKKRAKKYTYGTMSKIKKRGG